ncbi:MAG: hypothetical protein AB7S38_32400 [Vulcanimicrobiota bacterium]
MHVRSRRSLRTQRTTQPVRTERTDTLKVPSRIDRSGPFISMRMLENCHFGWGLNLGSAALLYLSM